MRAKLWVPLVLSVTLGLIAAIIARKTLLSKGPSTGPKMVSVVVAARDIDAGTQLTATDLTTMKYPAAGLPEAAFTDPSELSGRVNIIPLAKGQLTVERLLAPKGTPPGLQALVPDRMRAITIEISEFSGLAGMLSPGDRVDVICNLRDERTHESAARTIVQNVPVLAVGRQTTPIASQPGTPQAVANSVTLLVSPAQAQSIQLAAQGGRPWLALRGFRDNEQLDAALTSQADLRGQTDEVVPDVQPAAPATQPAVAQTPVAPAVKPAEPAPKHRVVTLILGSEEHHLSFVEAPSASEQLSDTDPNPVIPK